MSARAAAFRARYLPPADAPCQSPWLDSSEGADLVRCPNRKAFRAWARRAGIIAVHRGSRVLYAKRDVYEVLVTRTLDRSALALKVSR
jgi:hypothetical protein